MLPRDLSPDLFLDPFTTSPDAVASSTATPALSPTPVPSGGGATLYKLEDDLAALLNTVDLVPEEDEVARLQIFDEIAETTAAAKSKRDGVARYIRTLQAMQVAMDVEVKWMAARMARVGAHEERVTRYVVSLIEQYAPDRAKGAKRLEGNLFALKLAKRPDCTVVSDLGKLPARFKRIRVEMPLDDWEWILRRIESPFEASVVQILADATAKGKIDAPLAPIKAAIKAGEDVPGADVLYGGNRLEIA